MVIIDRMHKHGYKWIFVGAALILAAWFGYLNWAYADIYDGLNAQRERAGLPLLTGNDQIDFRMLVRECKGGIRYSCALARQLQGPPQQQIAPQYSRQPIQPIPFDLNNPLEGIPPEFLNSTRSSTPNSSYHGETRQQCLGRVEKLMDNSMARQGSPGVSNSGEQYRCLNLPQ